MSYNPRLTEPSSNDLNWIHTSKGGKNSCILITGNSVLPNCVGYAWGRFMEVLGSTPKLARTNAENWYNYNDGYERGSEPRLGAVLCFAKGKAGVSSDGAGHVAIVEKINTDGSIVTSNSDYGGKRFFTRIFTKPYSMRGYTFQGFIYNPAVKCETVSKSTIEIANEVIAGKWGNGEERRNRLTQAGYDYQTIQNEVNRIVKGSNSKPSLSVHDVALQVIQGFWGNGEVRKQLLTEAGYNYQEIQDEVNRILR